MKTHTRTLIIQALILWCTLSPFSWSETTVLAQIDTDTVWDLAGSPYLVRVLNFQIREATLTIEEDVIVELPKGSTDVASFWVGPNSNLIIESGVEMFTRDVLSAVNRMNDLIIEGSLTADGCTITTVDIQVEVSGFADIDSCTIHFLNVLGTADIFNSQFEQYLNFAVGSSGQASSNTFNTALGLPPSDNWTLSGNTYNSDRGFYLRGQFSDVGVLTVRDGISKYSLRGDYELLDGANLTVSSGILVDYFRDTYEIYVREGSTLIFEPGSKLTSSSLSTARGATIEGSLYLNGVDVDDSDINIGPTGYAEITNNSSIFELYIEGKADISSSYLRWAVLRNGSSGSFTDSEIQMLNFNPQDDWLFAGNTMPSSIQIFGPISKDSTLDVYELDPDPQYYVSQMTITNGATLEVKSGVTLKLNAQYETAPKSKLVIEHGGSLIFNEGSSLEFRDIYSFQEDDGVQVKGNLNMSGASTSEISIFVHSGGHAEIQNSILNAPLIFNLESTGTLTDNEFNALLEDNSGDVSYYENIFNSDNGGLIQYSGAKNFSISENIFSGTEIGINNISDYVIDATGNNWGHPTGPSNIGGQGSGWLGNVFVNINNFFDLDNDGIVNSLDSDDDGDGLSDIEEESIGTDPLLRDSDGDGYSDYEEISANNNPLDANDYPDFRENLFMRGWRLAIPSLQ